jgi:hypothetical protein
VEFDAEADRWIRDYLPALLIGAAGAFCYLALLARAHLRARLLVDLYREAGRLRLKQEEIKKREGDAPHLQRYQRLEQGLLQILAREGLIPPAPAPVPTAAPQAAPARPAASRAR